MARLRTLVAAAITVAAAAGPVALAAPARAADPPGAIGLDAGADLLAVPAADANPGHLVVAGYTGSAGATRTGVVVTDAAGADPVTVEGITDVASLALGPDGRTVYVASHDDLIGTFSPDDPNAPDALTTYPTGTGTCPRDLAVATDGRVFFTAGCDDTSSLMMLDPADGSVSTVHVGLVTGDLTAPLRIENTPARPDVMAVFQQDAWVDLIDVSGSQATELGAIDPIDVEAVAVAPDGQSALVGRQPGNGSARYSIAATPTRIGAEFPADGYPVNGLAVDPSGTYVAASSFGDWFSYGPSSEKVLRSYASGGYDVSLGRGVAWLGGTLFTMATDLSTSQVFLHARPDATVAPTTVTATGPATAQIGTKITITGSVTDRGAPVAWAPLTVIRTDYEKQQTYTTHTGPGGNFVLQDTPVTGGGNNYRVSYAGTSKHAAAATTYVLAATRLPTFLSIGTDVSAYQFGQTAHVTAHLGSTYTERHVAIYAQRVGGNKTRIAYGTVDSAGKLHAAIAVYHNTVFSASFAGDRHRQPVAVSITRKTYADPELTLENYYGTNNEGYRLYHKSQYPKLHAHVNPGKANQCVYFGVQQYVSGKWHQVDSSDCFRLSSYSNAYAYWDAPDIGVIGRKYRAGYWWPGDSENAARGSYYRYFTLTS